MARIRWISVVAVALAVSVFAGCGDDDSEDGGGSVAPTTQASGDDAPAALVEAAKEEGEVSWYNGQSPEKAQQVIDGFEEKYGIKVEALRLAGSQLTQRYLADVQAGDVPDAISTAVPAFFEEGAGNGLFMKVTPDNVPAAADYPADAIVFDKSAALTGITPWQVIVNTDVTEEAPKTWEDVLKPEFADQIVFPDPRIIPTVLGMTQVWYDELGPDFLERFGAQNPTVVESAVPGIQSVAAGEKKILVATEPAVSQPLIDEGAPLENVLITPINGTEMFMGISKDAPHPNAARLLMSYVLSAEGQTLANSPDRVSPKEDVPNTAELPDGYIDVDLKKADGNKEEIFQLLGLG
jgi:iron(III) transport system substrate-binding protein